MKIITAGRKDLEDFFALGPAISSGKLAHTPFLVFVAKDDTVVVAIVDDPERLRACPPETPVMAQWPGQWRSDFFQMTAGDVVRALDERAAREKLAAETVGTPPTLDPLALARKRRRT